MGKRCIPPRRLESYPMETRPLLLGHRGARFEKTIPENTPAAFDYALASGCDGFEFDVHLTADGHAVICHDDAVHGRKIAESSSAELKLPLLREVLVRYQNNAFLDIELKVNGIAKTAVDLLQSASPVHGVVVSSFAPEILQAIRRMDPRIPLGLICETQEQFEHWPEPPIDYVIPYCGLIRQDTVAQIKSARKKVFTWTVNLPAEMKRLAKWGVDGIISDHPARLAATLRPTAAK